MDSQTISQSSIEEGRFHARGREIFIRLTLLAAMAISCAILLRPFLNLIICGIIIAIGMHPVYLRLTKALNGRNKLAAALCSVLLLLVAIVPALLLADTLMDGIQKVLHQVQAGRLDLPAPPSSLSKFPLIGPRLTEFWVLCSSNLSEVFIRFRPEIQERIPAVLAAFASIGATTLQFIGAILLAGYLLATSEANSRFADKLFARIFVKGGPEFKELASSTIRTVTNGILGVAVIQTIFASLGFWIEGLPGAGLWGLIFLVAAVLQVGVIVLIPAVLVSFAIFSKTRAVIFLVWCIIVGLMDNVLKPILLGRGGKVPMIVVLLGVLGGFIAMNSIIGLFVGAIVLSVGYKLFLAWLNGGVSNVAANDDVQI
jgi:predicted PurR-regulated permease PerM